MVCCACWGESKIHVNPRSNTVTNGVHPPKKSVSQTVSFESKTQGTGLPGAFARSVKKYQMRVRNRAKNPQIVSGFALHLSRLSKRFGSLRFKGSTQGKSFSLIF